ncbi:MAG: MltA domain-containing protein [Hyphomicrobiales bacterium]|nr:MltA domain-containing protein [Hyphomicrobiales bacterium]
MELWRWQHGGVNRAPTLDRRAVGFDDLPGWGDDDHAAALRAFQTSLGVYGGLDDGVRQIAAETPPERARAFFETYFQPIAVNDGSPGLLTGYFEPRIAATRQPDATHAAPIYALPGDLELATPKDAVATRDPPLTAGRRRGDALEPYFTRAEIEDGALAGRGLEIGYAADAVDLFIMHVQGGGVLDFADGPRRATFAGKNGWPYTSIARVLIERGELTREAADMAGLLEWLRRDAERASALMRENQSYIFFRLLEDASGPVGSAGVALMRGRSLAADPRTHAPGALVWLDAPALSYDGAPLRRLTVVHDTGSAIVGPARGDLFCGSGAEAGAVAGRMKHGCAFFALQPKAVG